MSSHQECQSIGLDLSNTDLGRIDDTAVAILASHNGLGCTAISNQSVGRRVGRGDVALGRNIAVEVVASIGVIASRDVPFEDLFVKAINEARLDQIPAMILILENGTVGIGCVGREGDRSREVGCSLKEEDRVEHDNLTLARFQIARPVDGAVLDMSRIEEVVVDSGAGKRSATRVGQHDADGVVGVGHNVIARCHHTRQCSIDGV